ncbi:hypothetical protein ADUPG1_006881 [Aduncisulcus paluster]|uniref:Uncharacterized protein n=1 Tax=Aduncisulcus paluster TaxID=2918883 RepID=A0ABQ5KNE0_9EUKA|nr:hypothetical protein ADUPG1_006881 [Aduncisulcus paluster]
MSQLHQPQVSPIPQKAHAQLKALIESIKQSPNSSDLKCIYEENIPHLKTIFKDFTSLQSSTSISSLRSNRDLFTLWFECLLLFIKHKAIGFYQLKEFFEDYLDPILRVEAVLREGDSEEEEEAGEPRVSSITMTLFMILNVSILNYNSLCITIYPRISPLLSQILTSGQSQVFSELFIETLLGTITSLALSQNDSTKSSLLSLLLPHILPWMEKYPDKKFFLLWVNILKNITSDKDNINPHKDRCSQLWFVFHPVLDVVKDIDIPLDEDYETDLCPLDVDILISCISFFSHLSSIPSQAIEVCNNIKDGLLDGWLKIARSIKEYERNNNVIECLFKLISMFPAVPELIPYIAGKYDEIVEWYHSDDGSVNEMYEKYLTEVCASRYFIEHDSRLKELSDDIETITKKSMDSEEPLKLYPEHKEIIEELAKENSYFIRLPLLTLIKPFIINRLKSPDYSGLFSSDLSWSFILVKITKPQHYHLCSHHISNSPGWAPRSWICYPKALCSEAWSLFHPFITRFAGEFKRFSTFCSNILEYFANLCYDSSHAIEVFESIKDYLDLWFERIVDGYKLRHKTDPIRWSILFALLSTNSSLIPYLSPKYDETVIWSTWNNPHRSKDFLSQKLHQYPLNVSSYLSTSHAQKYFHSIPFVCLIPTIETISSQLFCGFFSSKKQFACHIPLGIKVIFLYQRDEDHRAEFYYSFAGASADLKSLKTVKYVYQFGRKNEDIKDLPEYITHSSLIRYKPAHHILTFMKSDEERSLRHSLYDFVEQTSA